MKYLRLHSKFSLLIKNFQLSNWKFLYNFEQTNIANSLLLNGRISSNFLSIDVDLSCQSHHRQLPLNSFTYSWTFFNINKSSLNHHCCNFLKYSFLPCIALSICFFACSRLYTSCHKENLFCFMM